MINTLIKYEFLAVEKSIVNRYNETTYKNYEEKVLNQFQQKCVDKILIHSMNNKFLIHGITGSGKTEIYMNLVKNMMRNNKDSIILIPEIALTPQMVERFKGFPSVPGINGSAPSISCLALLEVATTSEYLLSTFSNNFIIDGFIIESFILLEPP